MKGHFVTLVRPRLLATCATLFMLASAPYAGATAVRIHFGGTAGSGYADLTIAPDPNASSLYQPTFDPVSWGSQTSPPLSPYDPAGAMYITDASGTFNGMSIAGVKALSHGPASPGEILPDSFSWIYTTTGQNSYDNLFYPDGSPIVCPPTPANGGGYPFFGGFLDTYGVMFALDNGGFIGLWSDGVTPPGVFGPTGGLTWGINVFKPDGNSGYTLESSQFAGAWAAVPEPDYLWLFGIAILGLFAWRRAAETRKRTSTSRSA